jgi:predicted permease
VTGVANAAELPTTMGIGNGLFVEERPWGPNEPVPIIRTGRVSDDFFKTLGIPLRQGRFFNSTDVLGGPPVIIISEAMAKKYWPKGNAVGSRMRYGPPDPNEPWVTVVGVVGNVRNNLNLLGPEPIMFLPLRQQPFGETFIVRTAGEPEALVNTVRRVLREIDPGLPMYQVSTMQGVIDGRFAARRLPVMLMMGFGGLALLLASVGIYAMFASMASAREREFGVRIALGSSRGAVARLVLRQGGVWMVLGLVLGALGVAAASRLVRTQLYRVPELDPISIGAAVVVLLLCAIIALLMPVRRATRVDPITVLR